MRETSLSDHYSARHVELLHQLCLEDAPDCILVECVRLAFVLDGIPATITRPLTVVDTHDVMYERHYRFLTSGYVHDIDIGRVEEGRSLARFHVVVAIQARDAELLRALAPRTQVIVAGYPNSVRRLPARLGASIRLGFVGSGMAPNVEALKEFALGPWQTLRSRFGERISLHVFGGVSEAVIGLSLGGAVVLEGFVSEIERVYSSIDIVINPVKFGGGLKIKNVEALSFGKPLVTTSIGAEGLETGVGTAFLVGDTDQAMIDTLSQLIDSVEARESLAERAAQFALTMFSEDAVYSELDRVLASRPPLN